MGRIVKCNMKIEVINSRYLLIALKEAYQKEYESLEDALIQNPDIRLRWTESVNTWTEDKSRLWLNQARFYQVCSPFLTKDSRVNYLLSTGIRMEYLFERNPFTFKFHDEMKMNEVEEKKEKGRENLAQRLEGQVSELGHKLDKVLLMLRGKEDDICLEEAEEINVGLLVYGLFEKETLLVGSNEQMVCSRLKEMLSARSKEPFTLYYEDNHGLFYKTHHKIFGYECRKLLCGIFVYGKTLESQMDHMRPVSKLMFEEF